MVRKFAAALVAVVIAAGSIFAEEVKGVFVKFADGKLTLKVDDKEKDYKIPSALKIKYGKDGREKLASNSWARPRRRVEVTLTVDGDKVWR